MKNHHHSSTIEPHLPASHSGTEGQFTRFNFALVWKLGLAVLVAGLIVHMFHAHQVARQAEQLLSRVNDARQDGNVTEAIRHLTRYLRFRRDDTKSLATLGLLLDYAASSARDRRQVFLTLEEVLRRDSDEIDQNEIRRRLVDVAMSLGRYSDALEHLKSLLPETGRYSPDDAELVYLSGRCHEATGRITEALMSYSTASRLAEKRTDYYVSLISLLNREADRVTQDALRAVDPLSGDTGDEEQSSRDAAQVAERLLDELVTKGRPASQALLARAQFRIDADRHAEAEEDVRRAADISGYEADVLRTAADLALAQAARARQSADRKLTDEHLERARRHATQGLKKQPLDVSFFHTLGRVESESGRNDEAVKQLRAGLVALQDDRQQAVTQLDQLRGRLDEHLDREEIGKLETRLRWLSRLEIEFEWSLADALVSQSNDPDSQLGDTDSELAALLQSLRKKRSVDALLTYVEARIDLSARRWFQASRQLELCRSKLLDRPELVKRIDLSLAYCYEQLQNPDARLDVFRRALRTDPTWGAGRRQLAEALVDVNRLDAAIQEYQLLLANPGIPTTVARLLLLKEVARPGQLRNWQQVEHYLGVAEQVTPGAADVAVLRAELLVAQGQIEQALELLTNARETHPDAVSVWTTTILLTLHRGGSDPTARLNEARRVLDEGRRQLGESVELTLVEIALVLTGPKEQALSRLEAMEEGLSDELSKEQRMRILEGVAQAFLKLDAPDRARDIWLQMAAERSDDVGLRQRLAELAIPQQDADGFYRALAELRQIEGANGPLGDFLEAAFLVEQVARDDVLNQNGQRLAEALERPHALLQSAAKARPHWPAPVEAMARLEKLRGNRDEAIYHYRQARIRGDESPDVVQELVTLLLQERRVDEADQELVQYQANRPISVSGELTRLALQTAWNKRQFHLVLELADELGRREPLNYKRVILEAEALYASGKPHSAVSVYEEFFRTNRQEAYGVPELLMAYCMLLARENRHDEAREAIARGMPHLPSTPQHVRLLTLAECYDALRETRQSEEYFQKAVDSSPGDASVRLRIADFLTRNGRSQEAEPHLQQILDSGTGAPPSIRLRAAQTLAMIFAARGEIERARELVRLDERTGETGRVTELRNMAAILRADLARRESRARQRELIDLLEQLSQHQPLTPQERFELARLYEATGNWPDAREALLALVRQESSNHQFLAHTIQSLLRHDEVEEAESRMMQLERLRPDAFLTVTTRARLLAAQNRPEEAVAVLKEYLTRQNISPRRPELRRQLRELALQGSDKLPESQALFQEYADSTDDEAARTRIQVVHEKLEQGEEQQAFRLLRGFLQSNDLLIGVHADRLRAAALLMESIGQGPAAAELYEQYVALSGQPEAVLVRAAYLGRQRRIREALDLCEVAWSTAPSVRVANLCVSLIRTGSAQPDDIARVSAWLEHAVAEQPDSDRMWMQLAALRDFQQQYAEAAEIYSQIIERNRRHTMALNNLAWLSAVMSGRGQEALSLINRAIEVSGPIPLLLDTRAEIYLVLNEPAKAVQDLRKVLSEDPSGVFLFHLAKAQAQAQDLEAAKQAYKTAIEAGFTPQELHPLEKPDFDRLRKALTRPSG